MKLVENKILNIVFQIAMAVGIAGLIMYLLQEIVTIWIGTAYTILLVIADFVGIITLIILIVWMFISSNRAITLNIAYLGGAIYVFLYSVAHFFVLLYRNSSGDPISTGSIIRDYIDSGVSLIGLVALVILSIFMIVILSLRFVSRDDETPQFVKFALLIWFILIAIYDFSSFYYVKQSITYGTIGSPLQTALGITFLPNMLELVFILFAGIIIIFKIFGKIDSTIFTILTLTLVNLVFFALAITTVSSIGFVFTNSTRVPSVIGNHFIMIGTLATIITTFVLLIKKYPARLRAR